MALRRTSPSRSARAAGQRKLDLEPEAEDDARSKKKGAKPAKSPVKVGEERRERVKLTINNAFDEAQRQRSLASLRRKREREKLSQAGMQQPRDKVMREVIIPEVITIQELANRMAERGRRRHQVADGVRARCTRSTTSSTPTRPS